MPSIRCSCNVFDPITHRIRKCKNKKWLSTLVCAVHLRKAAITIQSLFRMKRTQKRINYFKQLPDDCWSKILYWTKYDTNVRYKYVKPLCKLYQTKIEYHAKRYDHFEKILHYNWDNPEVSHALPEEELIHPMIMMRIINGTQQHYKKQLRELHEYQGSDKRMIISF